jgi:hypothetical protein
MEMQGTVVELIFRQVSSKKVSVAVTYRLS